MTKDEKDSGTVDGLIWGVVAITSLVAACITALTIWRPGDNTAVITSIIGVATPAISVLVLLLQGQKTAKKVDEVKQETRFVADVTAENLEGARDSARKAKDAHEKTTQTVKEMSLKVDEIKTIVNGRQDELQRRIADLEEKLRRKES